MEINPLGLSQKFLLLFTMSLIVGKLIINEFGNEFINHNVIYISKNDLSNAFDGETRLKPSFSPYFEVLPQNYGYHGISSNKH